ncbi:HAD domain-containing protein [Arthrobacter sp. B3I9]|uniref:HAD domain-containing protein n=1 Tax=Arthrobacter sp. B3I9 TaxID=3042270 RepID=UPI0027D8B100|nr:HAD domain-containing protein [Arthrobacter sp. B3I9]
MKPIILLDVNGVLNPKLQPDDSSNGVNAHLSDLKAALVRRLATKGRIAWVSSSRDDLMNSLEAQLSLEVSPLRVAITPEPGDEDQQTPKLGPVARWLNNMEAGNGADWDAVVWIDDALGADVHDWAHHYHQPVLLEKPDPEEGLTEAHVVAVQVFINGEDRGPAS